MSQAAICCVGQGVFIHCRWECNLEQQLWESVREILQKLKVKLLCPPVTSQFGTYPKHLTFNPTDTYLLSTGEQEVWCIDCTAAKKKEKMDISGKLVELEITILSEVAQTQ